MRHPALDIVGALSQKLSCRVHGSLSTLAVGRNESTTHAARSTEAGSTAETGCSSAKSGCASEEVAHGAPSAATAAAAHRHAATLTKVRVSERHRVRPVAHLSAAHDAHHDL